MRRLRCEKSNGDVNSIAVSQRRSYHATMSRQARIAPSGLIYHVTNCASGKLVMHRNDNDFAAFEHILIEAHQRQPMRILGYCVMGNHWHLVVWPSAEGQVSRFFNWMTLTHAVRWRVAHRSVGQGHLYRGRFKAFPVQRAKLPELLRYVERNALSAGLVERAEAWRWGSLWAREKGSAELRGVLRDSPVELPANWRKYVNQAISPKDLARLELSERREQPYGDDRWLAQTVARLGLENTVRPQGRPKNIAEK